MTIKDALEAAIEYRNDNLFRKVLTDHGLNPDGYYAAGNRAAVDLALADVCLYLATHPQEREGDWSAEWSPASLLAQRRRIYAQYGMLPPEEINAPFSMTQGNDECGRIW